MANESMGKIFLVAFLVCFVCSVLVSATAVGLKAKKERDKLRQRHRDILGIAGLLEEGKSVDALFEKIESRVVELDNGDYSDMDPNDYDQRKAAGDPAQSVAIPEKEDLAGLKKRARYAPVYLLRENGRLKQIILPVHGKGLWSTLYGYIALAGDLNTVSGFGFYEHAETPGLGGEVDNPNWRALWVKKQVFDAQGQPRIEVAKGSVDPNRPGAKFQVDGLSGATVTSRAVTNLLHYWLGENGFGPYLAKLRKEMRTDG